MESKKYVKGVKEIVKAPTPERKQSLNTIKNIYESSVVKPSVHYTDVILTKEKSYNRTSFQNENGSKEITYSSSITRVNSTISPSLNTINNSGSITKVNSNIEGPLLESINHNSNEISSILNSGNSNNMISSVNLNEENSLSLENISSIITPLTQITPITPVTYNSPYSSTFINGYNASNNTNISSTLNNMDIINTQIVDYNATTNNIFQKSYRDANNEKDSELSAYFDNISFTNKLDDAVGLSHAVFGDIASTHNLPQFSKNYQSNKTSNTTNDSLYKGLLLGNYKSETEVIAEEVSLTESEKVNLQSTFKELEDYQRSRLERQSQKKIESKSSLDDLLKTDFNKFIIGEDHNDDKESTISEKLSLREGKGSSTIDTKMESITQSGTITEIDRRIINEEMENSSKSTVKKNDENNKNDSDDENENGNGNSDIINRNNKEDKDDRDLLELIKDELLLKVSFTNTSESPSSTFITGLSTPNATLRANNSNYNSNSNLIGGNHLLLKNSPSSNLTGISNPQTIQQSVPTFYSGVTAYSKSPILPSGLSTPPVKQKLHTPSMSSLQPLQPLPVRRFDLGPAHPQELQQESFSLSTQLGSNSISTSFGLNQVTNDSLPAVMPFTSFGVESKDSDLKGSINIANSGAVTLGSTLKEELKKAEGANANDAGTGTGINTGNGNDAAEVDPFQTFGDGRKVLRPDENEGYRGQMILTEIKDELNFSSFNSSFSSSAAEIKSNSLNIEQVKTKENKKENEKKKKDKMKEKEKEEEKKKKKKSEEKKKKKEELKKKKEEEKKKKKEEEKKRKKEEEKHLQEEKKRKKEEDKEKKKKKHNKGTKDEHPTLNEKHSKLSLSFFNKDKSKERDNESPFSLKELLASDDRKSTILPLPLVDKPSSVIKVADSSVLSKSDSNINKYAFLEDYITNLNATAKNSSPVIVSPPHSPASAYSKEKSDVAKIVNKRKSLLTSLPSPGHQNKEFNFSTSPGKRYNIKRTSILPIDIMDGDADMSNPETTPRRYSSISVRTRPIKKNSEEDIPVRLSSVSPRTRPISRTSTSLRFSINSLMSNFNLPTSLSLVEGGILAPDSPSLAKEKRCSVTTRVSTESNSLRSKSSFTNSYRSFSNELDQNIQKGKRYSQSHQSHDHNHNHSHHSNQKQLGHKLSSNGSRSPIIGIGMTSSNHTMGTSTHKNRKELDSKSIGSYESFSSELNESLKRRKRHSRQPGHPSPNNKETMASEGRASSSSSSSTSSPRIKPSQESTSPYYGNINTINSINDLLYIKEYNLEKNKITTGDNKVNRFSSSSYNFNFPSHRKYGENRLSYYSVRPANRNSMSQFSTTTTDTNENNSDFENFVETLMNTKHHQKFDHDSDSELEEVLENKRLSTHTPVPTANSTTTTVTSTTTTNNIKEKRTPIMRSTSPLMRSPSPLMRSTSPSLHKSYSSKFTTNPPTIRSSISKSNSSHSYNHSHNKRNSSIKSNNIIHSNEEDNRISILGQPKLTASPELKVNTHAPIPLRIITRPVKNIENISSLPSRSPSPSSPFTPRSTSLVTKENREKLELMGKITLGMEIAKENELKEIPSMPTPTSQNNKEEELLLDIPDYNVDDNEEDDQEESIYIIPPKPSIQNKNSSSSKHRRSLSLSSQSSIGSQGSRASEDSQSSCSSRNSAKRQGIYAKKRRSSTYSHTSSTSNTSHNSHTSHVSHASRRSLLSNSNRFSPYQNSKPSQDQGKDQGKDQGQGQSQNQNQGLSSSLNQKRNSIQRDYLSPELNFNPEWNLNLRSITSPKLNTNVSPSSSQKSTFSPILSPSQSSSLSPSKSPMSSQGSGKTLRTSILKMGTNSTFSDTNDSHSSGKRVSISERPQLIEYHYNSTRPLSLTSGLSPREKLSSYIPENDSYPKVNSESLPRPKKVEYTNIYAKRSSLITNIGINNNNYPRSITTTTSSTNSNNGLGSPKLMDSFKTGSSSNGYGNGSGGSKRNSLANSLNHPRMVEYTHKHSSLSAATIASSNSSLSPSKIMDNHNSILSNNSGISGVNRPVKIEYLKKNNNGNNNNNYNYNNSTGVLPSSSSIVSSGYTVSTSALTRSKSNHENSDTIVKRFYHTRKDSTSSSPTKDVKGFSTLERIKENEIFDNSADDSYLLQCSLTSTSIDRLNFSFSRDNINQSFSFSSLSGVADYPKSSNIKAMIEKSKSIYPKETTNSFTTTITTSSVVPPSGIIIGPDDLKERKIFSLSGNSSGYSSSHSSLSRFNKTISFASLSSIPDSAINRNVKHVSCINLGIATSSLYSNSSSTSNSPTNSNVNNNSNINSNTSSSSLVVSRNHQHTLSTHVFISDFDSITSMSSGFKDHIKNVMSPVTTASLPPTIANTTISLSDLNQVSSIKNSDDSLIDNKGEGEGEGEEENYDMSSSSSIMKPYIPGFDNDKKTLSFTSSLVSSSIFNFINKETLDNQRLFLQNQRANIDEIISNNYNNGNSNSNSSSNNNTTSGSNALNSSDNLPPLNIARSSKVNNFRKSDIFNINKTNPNKNKYLSNATSNGYINYLSEGDNSFQNYSLLSNYTTEDGLINENSQTSTQAAEVNPSNLDSSYGSLTAPPPPFDTLKNTAITNTSSNSILIHDSNLSNSTIKKITFDDSCDLASAASNKAIKYKSTTESLPSSLDSKEASNEVVKPPRIKELARQRMSMFNEINSILDQLCISNIAYDIDQRALPSIKFTEINNFTHPLGTSSSNNYSTTTSTNGSSSMGDNPCPSFVLPSFEKTEDSFSLYQFMTTHHPQMVTILDSESEEEEEEEKEEKEEKDNDNDNDNEKNNHHYNNNKNNDDNNANPMNINELSPIEKTTSENIIPDSIKQNNEINETEKVVKHKKSRGLISFGKSLKKIKHMFTGSSNGNNKKKKVPVTVKSTSIYMDDEGRGVEYSIEKIVLRDEDDQ